MQELDHGMSIADSFRLRGRKPTEDKLPNLLEDIRSPVPSPQSPVPSPQCPINLLLHNQPKLYYPHQNQS
jgi:hypothetical protein